MLNRLKVLSVLIENFDFKEDNLEWLRFFKSGVWKFKGRG